MSAEAEAPPSLLHILAGEVVRLTWELLAIENLLEEKGVITRGDLRQEVARVAQGWAEAAALEGLVDPELRCLLTALRACGWSPGWRPPAVREGETP